MLNIYRQLLSSSSKVHNGLARTVLSLSLSVARVVPLIRPQHLPTVFSCRCSSSPSSIPSYTHKHTPTLCFAAFHASHRAFQHNKPKLGTFTILSPTPPLPFTIPSATAARQRVNCNTNQKALRPPSLPHQHCLCESLPARLPTSTSQNR